MTFTSHVVALKTTSSSSRRRRIILATGPWSAMATRDPAAAYLEAFGLAVRRQRQRLGLSQEKLSFEAELDRTYVYGVERGVRNPTVRSVRRIAVALGVRPSALFLAVERGRDGA